MKSKIAKLTMMAIGVTALAYIFVNKSSADKVEFDNDKDSFSYAIGVQVAEQLKPGMEGDVNPEVFSKAILDVLTDKELSLSQEQIVEVLQKKQEQEQQAFAMQIEENKKASEAYLAKNKDVEGVTVTDSGVQYKVLSESDNKDAKQALENSTVLVHYVGKLIDGTEFDSSYSRGEPTELPVNGVIEGWQAILPLMKEGDKWEVVIPSEKAYGEQGAGGVIGPNQALIFDIELVEVKDVLDNSAQESSTSEEKTSEEVESQEDSAEDS